MKPVEMIPRKTSYGYGFVERDRFVEIQKFVGAGCKYAEAEIFSQSSAKDKNKIAYVEKQGYDNVLNAHDFGAKIRVYAREGKVYFENLDLTKEQEDQPCSK